MVFELDPEKVEFPDPHLADDDGLLAIGGDLSFKRLILAYNYGIFPWFSFRSEPIMWWCPKERFVIFPDEIHISHSMKQLIRSEKYRVTVDEAFDEVIRNCGSAQKRNENKGAWLGEDIIKAYTELHEMGFAHSIEVWEGERLVGGLYGEIIGQNFIGESMFSLAPSASKLALFTLAIRMDGVGGLIDCQFETPHLKSMGGRHIPYDEYMTYFPMGQ